MEREEVREVKCAMISAVLSFCQFGHGYQLEEHVIDFVVCDLSGFTPIHLTSFKLQNHIFSDWVE